MTHGRHSRSQTEMNASRNIDSKAAGTNLPGHSGPLPRGDIPNTDQLIHRHPNLQKGSP